MVWASTYELAKEYGEYGLLGKLWLKIRAKWLYWLGTIPLPQVSAGEGRLTLGGRLVPILRTGTESDIQRLTREIGELRVQVKHFQEDTEQRFGNVEQDVRSLREELLGRTEHLQTRLDSIRRGTLRKERRGAWAFILGTTLVLVAALV